MEGQLPPQPEIKQPERNPLKRVAKALEHRLERFFLRPKKAADAALAGVTAMATLGLGCNPNIQANADLKSVPNPPGERIQGAAPSTYIDTAGQAKPIPDFRTQVSEATPKPEPTPVTPPQIQPAEIGSFHHLPSDRKSGVIITNANGQEQISDYKVYPTANKEQLWFEDQMKKVQERIGNFINLSNGPADLIAANQEFVKGVNENYSRSEIIESFVYLPNHPQNVIYDLKDSGAHYERILDDQGQIKEEVLSLAIDETGKRGPMTIKDIADVEKTFNLEGFKIQEDWKDSIYEEPDGTKSVKGKEKTLFKQDGDKDLYVRVFFGSGVASIDIARTPHVDTPPKG